jgi:hypothetical protein
MAQINIEVEFDDFGQAIIRIPHGRNQKVDAAKAAALTDALSKALGKVRERHIGDHHHEHGEGVGQHTHQENNT